MKTMKESEFHTTATEWQNAQVTHEWVHGIQLCQAMLGEGIKFLTNTAQDPTNLDEKVLLTDKCLVPGFESIVMHGCTQTTMMMRHCLNIMMQAPYPDD